MKIIISFEVKEDVEKNIMSLLSRFMMFVLALVISVLAVCKLMH